MLDIKDAVKKKNKTNTILCICKDLMITVTDVTVSRN